MGHPLPLGDVICRPRVEHRDVHRRLQRAMDAPFLSLHPTADIEDGTGSLPLGAVVMDRGEETCCAGQPAGTWAHVKKVPPRC